MIVGGPLDHRESQVLVSQPDVHLLEAPGDEIRGSISDLLGSNGAWHRR